MTTARTQPEHVAGACYWCGRECRTGAYGWRRDERGRKRMSCADRDACAATRARYGTIAERRHALTATMTATMTRREDA